MSTKQPAGRKPKARHPNMLIGGMQELVLAIPEGTSGRTRLLELLDELTRSLSKTADNGTEFVNAIIRKETE